MQWFHLVTDFESVFNEYYFGSVKVNSFGNDLLHFWLTGMIAGALLVLVGETCGHCGRRACYLSSWLLPIFFQSTMCCLYSTIALKHFSQKIYIYNGQLNTPKAWVVVKQAFQIILGRIFKCRFCSIFCLKFQSQLFFYAFSNYAPSHDNGQDEIIRAGLG